MKGKGIRAATATLEFQGLITKAGTTSLWRGSTPMVSAVPLQNALLMSGYGWGKRLSGGVDDEEGGSHNRNEQDVNKLCYFMRSCKRVKNFLLIAVIFSKKNHHEYLFKYQYIIIEMYPKDKILQIL